MNFNGLCSFVKRSYICSEKLLLIDTVLQIQPLHFSQQQFLREISTDFFLSLCRICCFIPFQE